MSLFLFVKFFLTEQLQGFIRSSVTTKVEARREELDEVIVEINNQDFPDAIMRWNRDGYAVPYKELGNDIITKIFNDFSLLAIENHMDNSEGGYVYFGIMSLASNLVWGDYNYGFYYSEKDEPIDVNMGNNVASNTKVNRELASFVKYWYRTEKITDHWWYFDVQWSYGNISPR